MMNDESKIQHNPGQSEKTTEEQELHKTWQEFNIALRDIDNNFDQIFWIRQLIRSGMKYLLHFLIP